MDSKFLRYYFEKRLYLENPPLKMKDFIKFCNNRGINIKKSKLEEFEKRGLFYPIFRFKAVYNEVSNVYMVPSFDDYVNEDFMKLYDDYIHIPKDKDFLEFDNFYDKDIGICKIYSYYSSFQIYSLVFLLNNDKLIKDPIPAMDKFIDILIATQIYAPYGRSNMRNYSLKTNYEDFHKRLDEFDLEDTLKIIDADEDELYSVYAKICNELDKYLGSDYAIQLWKSVDWKKKDKCIGYTRLGIEYLQWAMMLKRCIEDYLGREIFDVDEVHGDWEKVKNVIPSDEKGATLRGYRNEVFTNKNTGEYEFNLKRRKSYYLANSLTLDYHPKILLFVEGKTEEIMIPKFFEFYGFNHKNLGIEIIDIGGILNFYSSKTFVNAPNNKPFKAVVNNFFNLINFNLKLWQAIPCFIGDRENDIINKLISGKMFDTKDLLNQIDLSDMDDSDRDFVANDDLNDNLVTGWSWIWDNDFEIDNFKPTEIQRAINDVCGTNISLEDVENIYDSYKNNEKKGIKDIDPKVKNHKIEINKKAFEYMKEDIEKSLNISINDRKIFSILDELIDMSILNHSPVNTSHALRNQKELSLCILKDYNIFKRDEDGI